MKNRQGFVSNSSTSSFVCDICGETYTGWDASPSDNDCSSCENEHIFCNSHIEEYKFEIPRVPSCEHEFDREAFDYCPECGNYKWDEDEDGDGYYPASACPVCQFVTYSEDEMSQYLEKTRGVSREEVFAKVKETNRRRRKLYDGEYVTYVCEKFNLTDDLLLAEIKEKFVTFDKYAEFIRGY